MNWRLRADTFCMAIIAGLFGAVAALSAVHVVLARLRWIEWDNRAAEHAVLDPRPLAPHNPELAELASRVDPGAADDIHADEHLSPFAQAAGWRPRRHAGAGRHAERQRTVSSRR